MMIKKVLQFIIHNSSFIIILLIFFRFAHAQALDQLALKKGLQINGSLNVSTTAYAAMGTEPRRDPFAWFVNGNLNISAFGYAMPFSFNLTNQGGDYSQPFNQFRFAPTYKWIRPVLGAGSMMFSDYTLAGHMFDGVGLELTPDKWRVSIMLGTLKKAVPFDVVEKESYNSASFKRNAYGVKLAYEDKGNSYAVSYFSAKDKINSLLFIPDDATITPQQNTAIAISVKQNVTKRIFTDAEVSISALNRDIRSDKNMPVTDSESNSNFFGALLKTTGSTAYFDAIKTGVGYRGNTYNLQLNYERVAPDYTTLGAYNVVNDIRNITIAPMIQLFKGKINISANVGLQNNNLDNSKIATTQRWVGACNMNITLNDRWAFTGAYSNFTNYTKIRPLADPYFNNSMDTLSYTQINNTFNAGMNYRFGSKQKQHSFSLNTSYQQAGNQSAAKNNQNGLSAFITSNMSYTYSSKPNALSTTASVNYYQNNVSGINTVFIGPTLNVAKQFWKQKLKTSLTTTYNASTSEFEGNSSHSTIFNTSLNANYLPGEDNAAKAKKTKGKHSIGGSAVWLIRQASSNKTAKGELTVGVNYGYVF